MRRTLGGLSIFAPGASNEEPKIKAIEIAALLVEKYAFLSGAQAKNGCLIITMPEHPKFGSLSDRDAERIFKYLVGLAREDLLHRGFMLVLDRRREKWGTVKSCLNKVQKCFPAKINLVCLLKPRGFLQKYSKPGFVTDGIIGDAKIQVVSLNSVAELKGYIEKSQLTEDMGGTLDYRHDEWVQYRSAIESFQKNLQTSSNRIDELQQEFTRTRLSPSVQEIERILESQREMWHDVKEDIESSRQTGVTILDCITVHHTNEENTERVLTPDVKANAAELEEALTELESLENNFEAFWKSHKLKIQYGLEVCLFEREMSQTTGLLRSTLGNLSAMVDFGDSRDDAESLLHELKEFAEKSVELVEKAKSMISKGTRMMESNDQSKDHIKLKCDETRELCDKFEKEVQKRKDDLKKAMDIHESVEMVNKWCKTGVDLLATQPIDRFQSSEGAEKALEEIENFLKSPQGMNIMAKVRKMTPMSNALGNKTLISKVKDSDKRISEVNDMLAKRQTSLKKLAAKRPVQPVSGIPANPPKREEIKRKHSVTPKVPNTQKSPVIVSKECKKSSAPESTGKRPVSIALEPDSFQKSGGVQQSPSEPSMQTAIERFQKNLQTSSNRIDELQQEFTRTRLSPSVQEIVHILESQQEMWHDDKEDIESSRQTGVTILDCITVHHTNEENTERVLTPDVKANAAEPKGALSELESLENNEKFWKPHKLKIPYRLEVCLFEREMSQTTGLLWSTLGNLSAMVDCGDSRDDAESLLHELKEFAEKSVELVEKAKSMISKGTRMMERNDQSKDQIKLKCDETRELCDKFEKEVRKREEDLKKAMDIHECLEMVNKWCKTGVDLLATQPIDRFQSSEGAEKALEETENFLKSPQGINIMAKVRKMTPMSNALGNKTLISKVKDSDKRISEVNDMLAKRQTSLKKLAAKRPVQPVSGIPANPPKREEIKRKHSVTPKGPNTQKSPVVVSKECKKSSAPESTGKRPVSIALEPDSFQKSGGVQQSPFDPSMQTRYVVDGADDPEARKKREQVMSELIETEKDYVDDLECIINGYLKEFEEAGNKIPAALHGKKNIIFGNIEQIYRFHSNDFLCELDANKDRPSQVWGLFFMKSTEFEMYATYCKNQPSSEALRMDYINLPFFKECQDKLGHKLPLSAYLLKPVQRITKYQLLISEMMKLTDKNSTAFDDLEKALETMEGVLRHVNDVMHSCGIKGFRGNLVEQGKLLLQDTFTVWETNGNWNLNLLPSKGGKQRQVFMYQKMIIFSKKDDDTSRDSVTYHYKKHIKTCDMAFTEAVRGDPLKFELSLTGRSEVFVMQPSSTAVKSRWVKEITNLMWLQFDEVKEAVLTEQTGLHNCWKSASILSSATKSSENGLPSRSQSSLSVVGPNIVGGSNRVSNIREFDDDEGCDTDECCDTDVWDSSNSSDDCATQQHQQQQTKSENIINISQDLPSKGSRYSALASYTALESAALSFQQGDIMELLQVEQNGWWAYTRHTATKQEGWVPASYLDLLQS